MKEQVVAYFSLFTSIGTLICCALPALLIAIGLSLGTVVTVFTAIPGWQMLGIYRNTLFLLVAVLLGAAFLLIYREPVKRICRISVGNDGETACKVAGRFHRLMLWASLGIYVFALTMDVFITPWLRTHGFFS